MRRVCFHHIFFRGVPFGLVLREINHFCGFPIETNLHDWFAQFSHDVIGGQHAPVPCLRSDREVHRATVERGRLMFCFEICSVLKLCNYRLQRSDQRLESELPEVYVKSAGSQKACAQGKSSGNQGGQRIRKESTFFWVHQRC